MAEPAKIAENVQEITNRVDKWVADGKTQLKVLNREHSETVKEQQSSTFDIIANGSSEQIQLMKQVKKRVRQEQAEQLAGTFNTL
jgi:hypothetical protein